MSSYVELRNMLSQALHAELVGDSYKPGDLSSMGGLIGQVSQGIGLGRTGIGSHEHILGQIAGLKKAIDILNICCQELNSDGRGF